VLALGVVGSVRGSDEDVARDGEEALAELVDGLGERQPLRFPGGPAQELVRDEMLSIRQGGQPLEPFLLLERCRPESQRLVQGRLELVPWRLVVARLAGADARKARWPGIPAARDLAGRRVVPRPLLLGALQDVAAERRRPRRACGRWRRQPLEPMAERLGAEDRIAAERSGRRARRTGQASRGGIQGGRLGGGSRQAWLPGRFGTSRVACDETAHGMSASPTFRVVNSLAQLSSELRMALYAPRAEEEEEESNGPPDELADRKEHAESSPPPGAEQARQAAKGSTLASAGAIARAVFSRS